jgi:23S rRNA (cytidine1920-2'-O)/16S rRNA (cytidine1409-2'-O)-methyltransferase
MPDFSSIDVSFISLSLILPVLRTLLVSGGDVVALIKPQFEAGKEQVGKKGIVRDKKVHEAVIEKIVHLSLNEGYNVENLSFSPITGGEGNIEFLIHLKWPGESQGGQNHLSQSIQDIVAEAHATLAEKSRE